MSINTFRPTITMTLYETDKKLLQEFIHHEVLEHEITERHLILFDFAIECRYAQSIQRELILYLIPFYTKMLGRVINEPCRISSSISACFSSAIFVNRRGIESSIGHENFTNLMHIYIEQTIKGMTKPHTCILNWISFFNTTVALNEDNILLLLNNLYEGSLEGKYSLFEYFSIFLFKERDNIVGSVNKAFWTDCVWYFDSEVVDDFFWNSTIIDRYDKLVNEDRIAIVLEEIKPLLIAQLGFEISKLICDEVKKSFANGIFRKRKTEFLKKIGYKSENGHYWYDY